MKTNISENKNYGEFNYRFQKQNPITLFFKPYHLEKLKKCIGADDFNIGDAIFKCM